VRDLGGRRLAAAHHFFLKEAVMKVMDSPVQLIASTLVLFAVFFLMSAAANAQHAPGEDPIAVSGPPRMLGGGGAQTNVPSAGLEVNANGPSHVRAKLARYEARAFAPDGEQEVATDNDTNNLLVAQGARKTCVQEIGSNVKTPQTFNRYGPKAQEQIVVLRGDAVNVCR
jgi:hypothetical protein